MISFLDRIVEGLMTLHSMGQSCLEGGPWELLRSRTTTAAGPSWSNLGILGHHN